MVPAATRSTAATDGRLLRGQASRAAILDAASRVVGADGIEALTHRAVATAAGMPLARVSYHFPTVDDLLVAAAGHFLAKFDERLTELAASSLTGERSIVDACTDFLVELLAEGREDFVAAVQVRIALHRRGLATDDRGALGVIRAFGAGEARAGAIFAAMFGFATLAATSPTSLDRQQVHDYVALVLGAMA